MKIAICMGSSCHVKGSKRIVDLFKEAIKNNGLENQVELCGSICMGHCAEKGANVKIDDVYIEGGVTQDNFETFFKTNVLDKVSK